MVLCLKLGFSQQTPFFSHYMYNSMYINPGAAGAGDMACLSLNARSPQWSGFDVAPAYVYANANTPFKLFGLNHGVGLTFLQEEYALMKDMSLRLSYAYRYDVGDGKLGFGLEPLFTNQSIETDEWITEFGDAPQGMFTPPQNDDAIPAEQNENGWAFNLNFGLFYKSDKLHMGISSQNINQGKYNYDMNLKPYRNRELFMTGGYTLQFSNPMFEWTPSFLIATDGNITQLALNTNVLYNKKIWGGVSYNVGNAWNFILGAELFKDVRVGYAFDYTTSDIGMYYANTHEFMIKYCFDLSIDKSPKEYKSIRIL